MSSSSRMGYDEDSSYHHDESESGGIVVAGRKDGEDEGGGEVATVSNWYYVACFCVTIASVLGTGILALPVKTGHSGFWPFFVMFLLVLAFELLVIYYAVDIMQRAKQLMTHGITQLSDWKDNGGSSYIADSSEENRPLMKKVNVELNLHTIGNLFLTRWARIIFDICVYVHFVSILISYVIAASESWGSVFGIKVKCNQPDVGKEDPSSFSSPSSVLSSSSSSGSSKASEDGTHNLRVIIVVFGTICSLALVFGQRFFALVVPTMTAVKGGLLVLMVAVAGVVAASMGDSIIIISDWEFIGDTFLMSTVALGGAVNLAPLIFDKVPQTKNDVKKFRLSVLSGLGLCSIFVLAWTFSVMKSVPQEGDPSLTQAEEEGCISTAPLALVIKKEKPDLTWIASIVDYFIMISVTISYLTVGSGLKNFLDGYVDTLCRSYPLDHKLPSFISSWFLYTFCLYIVSFGASIGIALAKPDCFLAVLEYLTSMALNLEAGAFISTMYLVSLNCKLKNVPLPLDKRVGTWGAYSVSLFFGIAVIYGIYSFIAAATGPGVC